MDLTLFIIFVVFSFMIYYLISSIQSLIKEMREVKNKCIKTNNSKSDDFVVQTPDPAKEMKKKAVEFFNYLKYE